MGKIVRLNESDIEKLVKKIIKEEDYDTNETEHSGRYMFFSNLQQIKRQCEYLLEFDEKQIEGILNDGHDWAQDHIAEAKNNMDQVFDFLMNEIKGDGDGEEREMVMEPQMEAYLDEHRDRIIHFDEFGFTELLPMNEDGGKGACANRGLSKPWLTPDGPKKRSVCVKNGSENVVKVNFGDPKMEIKRDNPKNKKSFRARHKCSQAKDRTTPKYWSCKMWSSTPVSKIVGEDLKESVKSSIFDKKYLTMKIQETFKHAEPMVEPQVKPQVKPNPSEVKPNDLPSRKNKPFTIEPNTLPKTDPKASK